MRHEIGLRPTLTEHCIQIRTLLERARARARSMHSSSASLRKPEVLICPQAAPVVA